MLKTSLVDSQVQGLAGLSAYAVHILEYRLKCADREIVR